MNTRFPDFLIIGAGKSGTTSLDKYLSQHPEIFMSRVKEPNFFALEGFLPPTEKDADQFFHFPWSITTKENYLKLFDDALANQIIGETSPMYMYSETARESIKKYIPSVKLIAILRHPAERIYSRFMHLSQENRAPSALEEVFNQNSIWWKRNDLVHEGFYFKHLFKYFQMFPEQNIHIILYDDFVKDRNGVIRELLAFLGIKSDVQLNTDLELNPSGVIKNKGLNSIIGKSGFFPRILSRVSPKFYEYLKNNHKINQLLLKIRKKNLSKPKLDPLLKYRITHEIYENDILELQKLIKRDLSSWLAKPTT